MKGFCLRLIIWFLRGMSLEWSRETRGVNIRILIFSVNFLNSSKSAVLICELTSRIMNFGKIPNQGENAQIILKINLRLAHLAGIGSERNLPFVESLLVSLFTSFMAGSARQTAIQHAVSVNIEILILKIAKK